MKTAQRQGRRTQLSKRALSAQFDLLERDAELAAAEALISASPSGGRLRAIEGPPGIGKGRRAAPAGCYGHTRGDGGDLASQLGGVLGEPDDGPGWASRQDTAA